MSRLSPLRRLGVLLAALALAAAVAGVAGSPGARGASADCPWMDASQTPQQRSDELLAAMTIDDKIALLHGGTSPYGFASAIAANDRLCIPELVFSDGPAGVAGGFGGTQQGVTAFPAPIAMAAAWDPDLQERLGAAMGREVHDKAANVFLAPAMNIARVPMNGRNYEYYGEDPFLAGQTAAAVSRGIQHNPVVATAKHYAVNNQETDRSSVSADVDARTLHEIYLPAFEAAVQQGGAGSVMCAYNRVNSVYACENPTLLTRLLKEELGFDGWVMSDWGATHSTAPAANAGLDQEQNAFTTTYFAQPLKDAVSSGEVSQARLDDMVTRIVRTMFDRGLFDNPLPPQPEAYAAQVSTPEHQRLALEVAEAGATLLKNDGGALPLDRLMLGQSVAVIGRPASPAGAQQVQNGSGSAHVVGVPVAPITAIAKRALTQGVAVTYTDGSAIQDAVAAATAADVAVVFAYDTEGEGTDRPSLDLDDGAGVCATLVCTYTGSQQNELIDAVAAANPNTVVVLTTGGPVEMPWISRVKSVLEAWYPGVEYGDAVAELLFGDVTPSGKLPQTFPISQADLPARTAAQYPGVDGHATYSEGLLVGYRWFDAQGIAPLFPFGHGLSYTTFGYRGLTVGKNKDGTMTATFTVTNTGHRAGAETAQVYVGQPAAAGEPPRVLGGYGKVFLQPGASKLVSVSLPPRAFAHWDAAKGWTVAGGTYRLLVGSSSRDIRLASTASLGKRVL